ncbi:uncharacterized protein STEHIDRAFT_143543 [Stereum hirsutum FP-91666 SS1]|uniref:uncharacterized protein n=1 Tax=Stereum hirsutum (strain FP-91666) TaxID=721885 RepID=UPI000440D06D|nr:uncharacterized protein STEHIDRAFT_143543 [Stereum hirsutum FP-91666 SS1]EIM92096.1 hypothetical protein STEHIDRAFT_143543 [Stereum hirsutum FP-91666 SS1]
MLGRILVALGASAIASAFNFDAGTPSECGDLTVTWSGGTAPYTLEVLPVFGTQRIHNISDSAYSNGKGSYTFQLLVAAKTQVLLSMSDATGWNTGGTSELLTVASNSSSACNTTDPTPTFVYELNSALAQCRTYTFSGYSSAVQPITINAVIPGGTGLSLTPPKSSDASYDWTVDVAAGNDLVFFLSDSQGNLGGVSNVLEVTASSDSSCLNSTSPSSTMTPVPTSTGSSSSSSSGVSGAAVGGAIAGVVAGIAALLALVWFFYRKRQQNRRRQHLMDLNGDYSSNHGSTAYLASGRYDATPLTPTPFPLTEPPMSYESAIHSPHPPPSPGGLSSSAGYLSSNGSRRKGATSASSSSQYNPRLIVHTDAADEDELIELPPSYSENRRPLPGFGLANPTSETPQQQASRSDSKVPIIPPPRRADDPSDPSPSSSGS